MDPNNFEGIPDQRTLERLANQFFKALPGSDTDIGNFDKGLDTSPVAPAKEAYHALPLNYHPDQFNAAPSSMQQLPVDPFHVPSTSAYSTGNQFSLSDPQTSLPDPHFYNGQMPTSVAGVGKSPTADQKMDPALEQGLKAGFPEVKQVGHHTLPRTAPLNNSVENSSLKNPQTSLPDPHFYNGQIPKSVAGSGRTPSGLHSSAHGKEANLPNLENKFLLPFEGDTSYENALKGAFQNYNPGFTGGQLPVELPRVSADPSYYFLSHANPFTQVRLGAENAVIPAGYVKAPFDINLVRNDFPILKERVNGKQLIWFDNAATTQKPRQVIERISSFYEHENSNIHRAAHELAARATDAYEHARKTVQRFLNAGSANEIVFVRGTTEAINLVAKSWGDHFLKEGDEIILSHLEHHANIVPWKMLADKKGLKIRVIPVDEDGQILLGEYGKLLNSKTKLVAFTQVSNALGTITPAKTMIEMAHAQGAKVLLDGAQSVSHMKVDLQYLNADFFVFSGHKIFGPTGIGVLYGKEELLNQMPPWQGGGNMIKDVTFDHVEYHPAPGRYEAGTGNIADAVGLGAALDYVSKIGIELIGHYEHALLMYATKLIRQVPGLRQVGTAKEKASVLSFTLEGYSNDQVGQALNREGIAVRTGHHCAQPILRRFGLETSVRPSLAFYNTCEEVNTMVSALHRLAEEKKGKSIYK